MEFGKLLFLVCTLTLFGTPVNGGRWDMKDLDGRIFAEVLPIAMTGGYCGAKDVFLNLRDIEKILSKEGNATVLMILLSLCAESQLDDPTNDPAILFLNEQLNKRIYVPH